MCAQVQRRFMNKSGGVEACPFLRHLVKSEPYIALGPNDSATDIHRPNESLSLLNIGLSVAQFVALLRAVANPSSSEEGVSEEGVPPDDGDSPAAAAGANAAAARL